MPALDLQTKSNQSEVGMRVSPLKWAIVVAILFAFANSRVCNAATPRSGNASALLNAGTKHAGEPAISSARVFACTVPPSEAFGDNSLPSSAIQLSLAMADFTGDSHPDLATVNVVRFSQAAEKYVIEVQLSEGGRQSLSLSAPGGGLIITPQDVTGDGTLDLVVRRTTSLAPIAIFINDGCGRFSLRDSGLTPRSANDDAATISPMDARECAGACAISSPSHHIADLNGYSQRLPRPAVQPANTFRVLALQYAESSNSGRGPPAL